MFKEGPEKMRLRAIILSVVSTLLIACVAHRTNLEQLSPESERIQLKWFSVATPGESGWYVAQRNAHAVQLAKQGGATDESYAIQAWSIQLPQFQSDDAFVAFIGQAIDKDKNSTRFLKKESTVSKKSMPHGVCVAFKSIHEDLAAAKRTDNRDPMQLEVSGMTCRNPKNQLEGAHLVYSNRYYAGNRDTSLPDKANAFFDSLAFEK